MNWHDVPPEAPRTIRCPDVLISLSQVMYRVSKLPIPLNYTIQAIFLWWNAWAAWDNAGPVTRWWSERTIQITVQSICQQEHPSVHAPTPDRASESHPSSQREFIKNIHAKECPPHSLPTPWCELITSPLYLTPIPRPVFPSICTHLSLQVCRPSHFLRRTFFSLSEWFLSFLLNFSVSWVLYTSLFLFVLLLRFILSNICSLGDSISHL